MTLQLDARQRAMLAEMGVPVFLPQAQPGAVEPAAAAEGQRPAAPAVAIAEPAGGHAGPAAVQRQPPIPPSAIAQPVSRRPSIEGGGAGASQPGVEAMDWEALQQAVAACRACGLCEGRRNTVFGVGDTRADWLLVGEAPGEQEDLRGEPFVGQAGKLLDNMLKSLHLKRGAGVYIANVLKCRPPGNRNPDPEEVARCEPFLRRQVELLQPKIIVAMGRFAVQALLRTDEPIGRLRGRRHDYHGVPLVVTYHPAYLLRNLPDKAKSWADLCLAQSLVRG